MVRWKINSHFLMLKDISFLGVGNIIPTIIAAIFWMYIASLIGDEGYGEVIYYLTIAGIGSAITIVGAQTTLNVYAAKGEKLLPVISSIVFTTSAIGGLVIFFMFDNLGAGIHVFSYVIFALVAAEFLGKKLFKSYMIITIIQKLLMVSFAIFLYHIIGNDGIIIGISLSFIPFIVFYYNEFKNNKIDFKILKSKKEFMMNNYILQLTRYFSASVDKFVIAPIFGFAILGNYALGMQFYMLFLIVPTIVFQYILPQDASGNPSIVLKKITILVSVVIAILGILFAPSVIRLLFPGFIEATLIVQIVSVAVIPGTISYMYISKFLGNLQSKTILISSGIYLITIILGMTILGKLFDVYGLAIAFVLAETFESIFLVIINKYYKIQKEESN